MEPPVPFINDGGRAFEFSKFSKKGGGFRIFQLKGKGWSNREWGSSKIGGHWVRINVNILNSEKKFTKGH